MDNFLVSAWLALTDFKNDNRSRGGSSGSSGSSSGSRRRSGYNPNQARGENGQWVVTSVRTGEEREPLGNLAEREWSVTKQEMKERKQVQAIQPESRPKSSPPKDVDVTKLSDGSVTYKHKTKEKNLLRVDIESRPDDRFPDQKVNEVNFAVNNDFDIDTNLSTTEKNRVSIKIAKIMQYDASQRKDGERYITSAWTADSDEYGAVRTYAYEKIANFSRPVNGEPGTSQFGIVKNGKVIPDVERLEREEKEWGLDSTKAQENAEEYRNTARNYRRSQKE